VKSEVAGRGGGRHGGRHGDRERRRKEWTSEKSWTNKSCD